MLFPFTAFFCTYVYCAIVLGFCQPYWSKTSTQQVGGKYKRDLNFVFYILITMAVSLRLVEMVKSHHLIGRHRGINLGFLKVVGLLERLFDEAVSLQK